MLKLDLDARAELWTSLGAMLEEYEARLAGDGAPLALEPRLDAEGREELARTVARFDFTRPMPPGDALRAAFDAMCRFQVHAPHPRYFGPFNPAPTTMGVHADALVAALNPQLATFQHAPFAVLAERHVLSAFAARFGYDESEGTFTQGGAEANTTAVIAALTAAFPEVADDGVRALRGAPRIYASAEARHSLVKAARIAGLGARAIRAVEVDGALRMRPDALARAVAEDRAAGDLPFLVVATAGTTSAGVLDPIARVADVAARERLWLHVDAAWGGFAALLPELAPSVAGLARADSITFDAHKSLSVPMGAGMYLSRRMGALRAAFAVRASYMPTTGDADPYAASMAWSRRFVGLKVLLSLAVAGWDGYAAVLRREVALGARLRDALRRAGFRLRNDTPLPVVCFDDGRGRGLERIARATAADGGGWISVARIRGERVLRACVVGHATREPDVDALVASLVATRGGPARTETG